MADTGLIALLTDFGADDWFVGAMKGAILAVAPDVRIVDICHAVPPGDVRSGAFALWAAWRVFPPRTIFVAVIDPGVGGSRAPLIAQTTDHGFVGPDNGLLSYVLDKQAGGVVRRIDNEAVMRTPVSATFHGRDIFGPAAAHWARGSRFESFGPTVDRYESLVWPAVTRIDRAVEGEIMYIDRFGNALTNIDAGLPATLVPAPTHVRCADSPPIPLMRCYDDAPRDTPLALTGSTGLVEIAVNGGNAARRFGLTRGARVVIA